MSNDDRSIVLTDGTKRGEMIGAARAEPGDQKIERLFGKGVLIIKGVSLTIVNYWNGRELRSFDRGFE